MKEAKVCGVMVDVSPVKTSTRNPKVKYFDGRLTDGKKTVRLVCFDAKKKVVLDDAKKSRSPIGFDRCEVKGSYEIIASTSTEISAAGDRKYDIDEKKLDYDEQCVNIESIAKLDDIATNQYVVVTVKIAKVDPPVSVNCKDGREQECIVADSSGSCRLVVWEKHIGSMEVGNCYKIKDVTVRMYDNVKYLSTSSKCLITECDDIGEIAEEAADDDLDTIKGEIVAVQKVNMYKGCYICPSGKVAGVSSSLGKCMKCQSTVKLAKCNGVIGDATITIESSDTAGQKYSCCVPLSILFEIIKVDGGENIGVDQLEEMLLSTDVMEFKINNKIVVKIDKSD